MCARVLGDSGAENDLLSMIKRGQNGGGSWRKVNGKWVEIKEGDRDEREAF